MSVHDTCERENQSLQAALGRVAAARDYAEAVRGSAEAAIRRVLDWDWEQANYTNGSGLPETIAYQLRAVLSEGESTSSGPRAAGGD